MNAPRAAKRGRGRPETPIQADFGPVQGILAGRVLLGYRTDPEAPSAPAIRGARRQVIYHQLWLAGCLTDEQHEAADRYLTRLEVASGAKVDTRGNGAAGCGPTMAVIAALADLRIADAAIGSPFLAVQVGAAIIAKDGWPPGLAFDAFNAALQRVADAWGM